MLRDSYWNRPVMSLVPFCDDSSSASGHPQEHSWGDKSQIFSYRWVPWSFF